MVFMLQTYEVMDYWDDEWDDDSESGDRERGGGPPPLPLKQQPSLMPARSASHHDDISLSKPLFFASQWFYPANYNYAYDFSCYGKQTLHLFEAVRHKPT